MRFADLAGKRVAVWGYGREGRAALTALRRRLPGQPLTLLCSKTEAEQARAFYGDTLECITTEPYAGLLWTFDVIVKSPGISAYATAATDASAAGVRMTSGTALWFDEVAADNVIAVTGTKGKSTTTALIAHLLRGLGHRVALAGNIGLPLLELLDTEAVVDYWAVELSSFQTREAGPLAVGVINNVYEEHLDWHGSRERYLRDKLALVDAARTLVVNAEQDELVELTADHPQRRLFGTRRGWHIADGYVCRDGEFLMQVAALPMPGDHNALNLCAALTALEAAGVDARAALPHVLEFKPLPHRLQLLGEQDGRRWINDSISTTPQATIEALRSVRGEKVTVLVGGFDRGLDWREFDSYVRSEPPHAIVTFGGNGGRIADLLGHYPPPFLLERRVGLVDAVTLARQITPAGGIVVLSPGAPSFDQFHDYADRGRAFAQLAGFDPQTITGIEGLGIS